MPVVGIHFKSGMRGMLAGLQVLGDLLGLAHHAQQVATGQIGQLFIAPAAARQFLEQGRVLVHVVQPLGRGFNAVEVGMTIVPE